MKVLYVNPTYMMRAHKSYVGPWADPFKKLLDEAKRSDTEVDVTNLGINSEVKVSIFPRTDLYYITDFFKSVVKAEQKGYDAVIIGCARDPDVKEAKRMVSIPVVGPSEAGIHLAQLLGKSWAIITLGPLVKQKILREYAWMEPMGLNNITIRAVNVALREELEGNPEDLPENLRDLILERLGRAVEEVVPKLVQSCVEEDGTEIILLGCTLWSLCDEQLKKISEDLKVQVLNPAVTALKAAENLADNCTI